MNPSMYLLVFAVGWKQHILTDKAEGNKTGLGAGGEFDLFTILIR